MAKVFKGLKFPFQRGENGFPAMSEGDDTIQDQMYSLILTGKMERVMRPTLGVNTPQQIFGEITQIAKARIAADTARAIREWIPRAVLTAVDVREGTLDNDKSTLYINVEYSVAGQEQSQQIPVATVN